MSTEKSTTRGLAAGLLSLALVAAGIAFWLKTSQAGPNPPAPPANAATAEPAPRSGQPPAAEAPKVVAGLKPGDEAAASAKGEHVMFGGTPARNMVSPAEKGLPDKFDPAGEALKWKADLGSRAYGGPIVAGGKVFVGTNNEHPRNKREKIDIVKSPEGDVEPIDKGILMCFDEKSGQFLWQAIHDKLAAANVHDWPKEGICSTPLVEGNRVYYVSNRCTVVCADVNGLTDGNQGGIDRKPYTDKTDADFIWEYDLMGKDGVFPHNMAAGCPLVVGDLLFTVTANGVDEGHINIPAPGAPSFVALDKKTGKVAWRSNLPGTNIMHGQWSNPCYAEVKGVKQVIFPGGDGWLYAFDPPTGKLLWKCDCNPKEAVYKLGGEGTRNDFIGTPVVYDGKVYIGLGQDPEHFTGVSHFWCIDPARAKNTGDDISPELGEWGKPGKPNPASGVVWHYGGADPRPLVPRDFVFGRTMSTACIVDDVLYISELQGQLHCLDAKTGKPYWVYDTKGAIWGSPYYADGKVYLATEGGDLFVFKHTKTPKKIDVLDNPGAKNQREFRTAMNAKRKEIEQEFLLARVEFDAPIRSTPVAANGTLYVMTEKSLYAFGKK